MLLRTAKEIGEQALRQIGAFPITDSAADPEELDQALHLLDIHMRYLAGTEFVTFLIDNTIQFDLTADEASFDLETRLGDSLPETGYNFPILCMLVDSGGNKTPIPIVSRQEFFALDDPDESGTPKRVYIDRTTTPTLRVHPIPSVGTFDIELTFTTYLPDIKPQRRGETRGGNTSVGMRGEWELWAIEKTAWACMRGPVRRMPISEQNDSERLWRGYEDRLITWAGEEKTTEPPVAKAWSIL